MSNRHDDHAERLAAWGAPSDAIEREHRSARLLDGFRAAPSGRRGEAVRLLCDCGRDHALLSVHPLPADEVAVWWRGGGRIQGDPTDPPDWPRWTKAEDRLEILPRPSLLNLRVGAIHPRCGLGGNVWELELGVTLDGSLRAWEASNPRRLQVLRLVRHSGDA